MSVKQNRAHKNLFRKQHELMKLETSLEAYTFKSEFFLGQLCRLSRKVQVRLLFFWLYKLEKNNQFFPSNENVAVHRQTLNSVIFSRC